MKERDLETTLLLRDSGELSPTECAELGAALASNPDWKTKADEMAVWLEAGPLATEETVPELPELNRARILQAAPKKNPLLPKLLAVAALLVIGLALLPHLVPPAGDTEPAQLAVQPAETTTAPLTSVTEDAVIASLDKLHQELDTLADWNLEEDVMVLDANDWASELLALEDSI